MQLTFLPIYRLHNLYLYVYCSILYLLYIIALSYYEYFFTFIIICNLNA